MIEADRYIQIVSAGIKANQRFKASSKGGTKQRAKEGHKMDRGQPRRYATSEELIQGMLDYLQWCVDNNQFPNVAGFKVHQMISNDTFYQQKNYYPDAYEQINDLLEASVLNNHSVSDQLKMFYLKNKFKYVDKVQQEISVPEPITVRNLDKLSIDELRMLKELTKKVESKDE